MSVGSKRPVTTAVHRYALGSGKAAALLDPPVAGTAVAAGATAVAAPLGGGAAVSLAGAGGKVVTGAVVAVL